MFFITFYKIYFMYAMILYTNKKVKTTVYAFRN